MATGTIDNDWLVNSDPENYGLEGNDTIIVSRSLNGGHSAYVEGGYGNDYIEINKSATLVATVLGGFGDNFIVGGYLGDELTGGGNNDLIYGAGTNTPSKFSLDNDDIWGGPGVDGLYGLQGNDVIHGGSEDDRMLVLTIAVGHDSKEVQFVGGLYGDAGNDKLYGEEGDDDLFGGSDDDYLDGGGGALNRLFGGIGNDTYVFNGVIDEVYEDPGAGYDTLIVIASQNNFVFSLPAGLEIEELQIGSSSIRTLAGNEYAQVLRGNESDNSFFGGGGADTVYGMGGKDFLSNQDGGADQLFGGKDDDSYLIYEASAAAFEGAGEGHDDLATYVSYQLSPDAEIEELRTAFPDNKDPLALTGNVFAQTIIGNAGDNTLHDGGKGAADMLRGLGGNDTYRVYNAADVIEETASQGTADIVNAAVSYVLGAGVHIETLRTNSGAATTAINLTGNALKQDITGNAGANLLNSGAAGASDTLRGLAGSDTYRVHNTGDTIVEVAGQGADKAITSTSYALGSGVSVEVLQTNLSAGTSAINLYGNEIAQEIIGNAGANRIDGKGGADTLRGLGGADTFVFATKLGGGNTDTIVDFNPAADRFLLSDAIFTALTPGTLAATAFRANTTGEARDATDRIIYDTDSGGIFYDADGLGGAAGVRFAIVSTGLSITNADFDVA